MSVIGQQGGCRDCPTCRGEVQHDTTFLADLGFAVLQSRRAVTSAFWREADVRSAVQRAAHARDPLDIAKTMRAFDENVSLQPAARRRAHRLGAAFDESAPEPLPEPAPRKMGEAEAKRAEEKFETPLPPQEPLKTIEKGRECCVKTFDYPECWTPMLDADSDPLDVGFAFRAFAEYWPKSEKLPTCDCSCCEFRQYVTIEFKLPWQYDGVRKTAVPIEDCDLEYDGTDGNRKTEPLPLSRARNAKRTLEEYLKELEKRNAALECAGRRNAPGKGETYDGKPKTSCKYWYVDTPLFQVPKLAIFDSNWYIKAEFIGRIVDTCHLEAVKADERFPFEINAKTLLGAADPDDKEQLVLKGGPPRAKRKPHFEDCK